MSKKIGIIAEDDSDVKVVEKIIEKFIPPNSFSIKKFVGNGCGKLKSKSDSWTQNLFKQGCGHVFIFHDLDKNNRKTLTKLLERLVPPNIYKNTIIVIPVEELEAWLLSDNNAIKLALNLKTTPPHIQHCETIPSPKEHLQKLVYRLEKKKYINTIHNSKIAELSSLDNLKRCPSFLPFEKYIVDNIV